MPALVDFDRQVRIESPILVHAIPRVAAWIAYDSRSVKNIVEAVMRVAVYP